MQQPQRLALRLNLLHGCREPDSLRPVIDDHAPDSAQETIDAFDPAHAPRFGRFQRTHEHLVKPHAVGAVVSNDLVRSNDVAAALGHLVGVGRYGQAALSLNESSFLFLNLRLLQLYGL